MSILIKIFLIFVCGMVLFEDEKNINDLFDVLILFGESALAGAVIGMAFAFL